MEEEKSPTQSPEFVDYSEKYKPLPWVEKNGFPHWVVVFVWYFVGLFCFQLITNLLVLLIVIIPNVPDLLNEDLVLAAVKEHIDITFIINSIGQFLVIGLASFLISKAHASPNEHYNFLRLRLSKNVWMVTGISVFLIASSWIFVNFLGWLNFLFFDWLSNYFSFLSLFKEMQSQMGELISSFILSDNSVFWGLIYIGLVPAIFEEIMFRGYILRALEKSWGITAAIIVSGFLFGIYHLQPSNILPLACVGILLAYVTYISDSLIPAMILHFLYNGSQVIYASMNPEFAEVEFSLEFDIPIYLIISSMILTAGLLYLLYQIKLKTKPESEV